MGKNKVDQQYIYNTLAKLFPNAHCELNYGSIFQLTVAVILSAQTTDVSVNKVTPQLFQKYPTVQDLSKAKIEDVESIIKSIGLYRNKAKSVVAMAKEVLNRFDGNIPNNMDDLLTLPGIGRKTANVVLSEGFKQPAIAVDTHVNRVSQRLGITKMNSSPEETEEELKKVFSKDKWSQLHHYLIFLGRYMCHSRKPECDLCPFRTNGCKYYEN